VRVARLSTSGHDAEPFKTARQPLFDLQGVVRVTLFLRDEQTQQPFRLRTVFPVAAQVAVVAISRNRAGDVENQLALEL